MSKALELSQLANNLTITEGTDTVTLGQANVILSGNLQVDGTSTTLNTSTLTVDDLNITVADGAASAAAADGAGLTVDGANATLIYGSTNDNWSFNKRLTVDTGGDDANAIGNLGGDFSTWIRVGDGNTAQTQTNGFGMKLHDSGVIHWSVGGLGTDFKISKTNSAGQELFPATRGDYFTIDTNGNVSIGSTQISPGAALVVDGTGTTATSGSTLVLYDSSTTAADVGGSIMFSFDWNGTNGHLGSGPFIKGYKLNADTTDFGSGLQFGTRTNGLGNNAVAMTIDPQQRVGIGTTEPTHPLHVVGANVTTNGGLATMTVVDTTAYNGTNPGGGISFRGNYNNAGSYADFASIQGIKENTTSGNSDGALIFNTKSSGAGGLEERMRIDTDGNVGIGTNNPAYPLHVAGSNVSAGGGLATLSIYDSGTAYNATPGGGITFRGKFSNAGAIGDFGVIRGIKENTTDVDYASALTFFTRENGGNFTEKMRIDSVGNVGIGTNNPGDKFVVYGDGARMTVNSVDFEVAMLGRRGSSGVDLDRGYLRLRKDGVTNDGVVIDTAGNSWFNGGNVGIGTTTPSNNLTIDIGANNTGITLDDHGDGFFPQIIYDSNRTSAGQGLGKFTSNWNGTEVARIEFAAGADTTNKDDGEMLFYTKTSGVAIAERMRIDDAGNVGIGTNAPDTKFHIYDSGAPRLRIQSTSTALADTPGIDLIKKGSTTNGVDIGVINWYGNDSAGNETRYAYLFADAEETTSGSEDGRIFMTVARGGGTGSVYYEMRGVGGSDNPLNAHHEFRGNADGHVMHVRRDVIDRGNSGAVVAISLGENTGPEDDPWIDFYNYGTTGVGGENQVNGSIGTVSGNQGLHMWGYETLMLRATTDTDMPNINSVSGTGLTINSSSSTFYGTFNAQGISNFNNTTASTSPTTGSVRIDGGLGVVGDIHAGADVTAFSSSDQRLKTNLQPIENSLDKVKSITGYTFNWNELAENKPQDQREAGVLAQDVEEVLPEVTTTRDDGYKAVRYEKMVPMLIEAIKELSDKVDEQQQEIERLRKWQ